MWRVAISHGFGGFWDEPTLGRRRCAKHGLAASIRSLTRGRLKPHWPSITGLRGTAEPLMFDRTGRILLCGLSLRRSFTPLQFGSMANSRGNTGAKATPHSRSTSRICSIGEKQTPLPFVWTMLSMNTCCLAGAPVTGRTTEASFGPYNSSSLPRYSWNVWTSKPLPISPTETQRSQSPAISETQATGTGAAGLPSGSWMKHPV
jgi:hypothetical protein